MSSARSSSLKSTTMMKPGTVAPGKPLILSISRCTITLVLQLVWSGKPRRCRGGLLRRRGIRLSNTTLSWSCRPRARELNWLSSSKRDLNTTSSHAHLRTTLTSSSCCPMIRNTRSERSSESNSKSLSLRLSFAMAGTTGRKGGLKCFHFWPT